LGKSGEGGFGQRAQKLWEMMDGKRGEKNVQITSKNKTGRKTTLQNPALLDGLGESYRRRGADVETIANADKILKKELEKK